MQGHMSKTIVSFMVVSAVILCGGGISFSEDTEDVLKSDGRCDEFVFDASESYDMDNQQLSFLWNFGDGESSTEPVVKHRYAKGGEYTVSLTVQDGSGLPCGSAAVTQKIFVNTPPTAEFTGPGKVCVKEKVVFDASATKDDTPENLTFLWDLGDGTKGKGRNVTHIYDKGGQYTVSLTVNDNSGTSCSTDTAHKNIIVNTPPEAEAGDNIVKCLQSLKDDYVVEFDGSESFDVDGDALSYTWDLGDGTTMNGKKGSHVYIKGGQYKATLTVDDGSGLACSKDTDTLNVTLNKSPIAVAGSDVKAGTGEKIEFSGAASTTEPGENLSYEWSFGGDARATGQNVSHSYTEGGRYTVMLTVDDGRETACSQAMDILYVDVDAPPLVVLEGTKTVCLGDEAFFDASSSSDPDEDALSFVWDFGDGTKEEGDPQISHAFQKGGTYKVTVAVDDGKDFPCSIARQSVKVDVNTPPHANIVVKKACCVGMEQQFDASGSSDADNDKLSYIWDFGDGSTVQGVKAKHIYNEPGKYRILLTVNDNSNTKCSSDVDTAEITVNAKPVPVMKIR